MVSLRLFLTLLAPLILGSCQLPYLVSSTNGHLKLLLSRQSVHSALNDPALPSQTKRAILLSQEVLRFAQQDLHLKRTSSYQHFAQLDREYVTWLLTAAPQNELTPYRWSIPLLGQFPYLGFYSIEQANKEKQRLKEKGYDTYVRGVRAYSTLGWLSDPLLSSMTSMPEDSFVETILHECIHANIWIKGNVEFNERLAVFLADIATDEFYRKNGKPRKPTSIESQMKFSKFLSSEIRALEDFYKANPSLTPEQRDFQFMKIHQNYKNEFRNLDEYKWFEKLELNNAVLVSLQVYLKDLSVFYKSYERFQTKNKTHENALKNYVEAIQFLTSSKNPELDLSNWSDSLSI